MKTLAVRPISLPATVDQPSGSMSEISRFLPGFSPEDAAEFRQDVLIAPQRIPLRPTRRLVILVPEGDVDEQVLAHKIWRMASISALHVLFLSLSPDEESASYTRRRLALLAAAINQGEMNARSNVVIGGNWHQAVNKVLHSGDMLVCIAQHMTSHHAIGRRKMGEALAAAFDVPVYLLGGLQLGRSPEQLIMVRSILGWGVSIAILLAFGGLQIWLNQNVSGQLSPILLCLTIIAEGIIVFKSIEWIG